MNTFNECFNWSLYLIWGRSTVIASQSQLFPRHPSTIRILPQCCFHWGQYISWLTVTQFNSNTAEPGQDQQGWPTLQRKTEQTMMLMEMKGEGDEKQKSRRGKRFYLLAVFNEHFTSQDQPHSHIYTYNNTCLIHVAHHIWSNAIYPNVPQKLIQNKMN